MFPTPGSHSTFADLSRKENSLTKTERVYWASLAVSEDCNEKVTGLHDDAIVDFGRNEYTICE